jgi:CheY-like chemotaxis protein
MSPSIPEMILVIDDEPSLVRALARLLRRDGYRVGTAGNGARALEQLQALDYDVILCDLQMPELDGPTFYALLVCQYPALSRRVIFLTGESGSAPSMAFLTQCGRPWLRKPCTIATVRRAIQHVLHAA